MSTRVRNVLLVVFWLALWGDVTIGNLVAAIAAIVLVLLLAPSGAPRPAVRLHPVAMARLAMSVTRSLVLSSLSVALAALRPTPDRLRAAIVAVPLERGSPLTTTILAQLIGLTPGTLTVSIDTVGDRSVLYVHVLGVDDLDGLRRQVKALEAQVLAAHTPVVTPGGTPS
jgi:multicomponent Na+:H+ antiporter subunit E